MSASAKNVPSGVKVDREGDIYELYEKASKENQLFVIRIVQNRLTITGDKIVDEIKAAWE